MGHPSGQHADRGEVFALADLPGEHSLLRDIRKGGQTSDEDLVSVEDGIKTAPEQLCFLFGDSRNMDRQLDIVMAFSIFVYGIDLLPDNLIRDDPFEPLSQRLLLFDLEQLHGYRIEDLYRAPPIGKDACPLKMSQDHFK